MTWEGRRCGGFLTTQNQGKLGNLLKQTQKSNQPSQANHFSSKLLRPTFYVILFVNLV